MLSQVVPTRAGAILKRGLEFGQSGVVCNVHWQIDVEAGRTMASAAFARLHADANFASELAASKAEIVGVSQADAPVAICAAEAAALRANP